MKNTKQKIVRYLAIVLIAVLCCESTFMNVHVSMAVETEKQFSDDAAQFRGTLNQTVKVQTEDGEIQEKTIAEVLDWNIDDTSTWDGVTFTGDRITAIDFPPVSIGGVLDLTGLDKLESLTCIYTGFEHVILKGCASLRELTLCDNEITDLDIRDCAELESIDVSDNRLKHIRWGTHESLTWLNCIGNYLDTDTDEELLTVIHTLQANGWNPNYKYQRHDENAEYSEEDISFVRQMLDDGENQKLLGWDKEDITTWDGVQWKTVAGVNYINRIDIARCGLTGTLTLSGLKYIREFVCEGNAFTELDATSCRTLEQLNCANCELETLKLEGTDSLLYLDCRNNCLSLDAIEEWCREIASREGSDVNYERQYINASREAFCEEECQELERFAGIPENKEELKWDFTRPGRIPQIIWELQDGIYHVTELDIIGPGIGGTLDLSGFTHLKRIKLTGTEICKVILPESLKEIEKHAFINCNHLEEITLPSKLTEIGDMAFYNCENLKRIELPESVQKIGKEAFVNDEKLEEVIIKGNLLSIGDYAFAGCTNLKKVTFLGNAPETVGEEIFNRAPDNFVIYYNEKAAGWDNEYWSQYPIKAGSGFEGENPETPAPPSEETPKQEELPAEPAPGEPGTSISGKPDGINDGKISISQEQGNTSDNSKTGDKKYHVSKVKIQKIKRKKGMLTLTIKRNKKVSGYEVFIRKGRKDKFKVRRLKGWKKNRLTVKKLKKNNVYYIKVRAYKVIAGKKRYSAFSKLRRVRIK